MSPVAVAVLHIGEHIVRFSLQYVMLMLNVMCLPFHLVTFVECNASVFPEQQCAGYMWNAEMATNVMRSVNGLVFLESAGAVVLSIPRHTLIYCVCYLNAATSCGFVRVMLTLLDGENTCQPDDAPCGCAAYVTRVANVTECSTTTFAG